MSNPYDQCQIRPHYGPNVPGEPILTTASPSVDSILPILPSGCAHAVRETMALNMKEDDVLLQAIRHTGDDAAAEPSCYQLNCINAKLDSAARWLQPKKVMGVPDVKIQYTTPAKPCAPCDVSYSVSAKIDADEYIAVGWKGRSWERDFPYAPEHPLRPCYFGMCIDAFDNFTSDRIALGYTANGGCVREMVAKEIVGSPVDADFKVLKGTSVERSNGRTIMHFTISQHWQWDSDNKIDGPWRVMWAIGKVNAIPDNPMLSACTATIGYHAEHRGVAPLYWLKNISAGSINACGCKFNDAESRSVLPSIV